jgi:heme/copper-type cytochrome/quinol oxidase subunit 1
MKPFKRFYDILLLLGFIFVLISFVSFKEQTLDIHLHDTYFVIAIRHIVWILALILWIVWGAYKLLNRFLFSEKLTRIHVVTTALLFLINIILLFGNFTMSIVNNGAPIRYNDYSGWSSVKNMLDLSGTETKILILASVVLLLGQLIFPINLSIGLIEKFRRKNSS